MHTVEPEVHLLARTAIDTTGLDEYLRQIGAVWESNAPSDVEEIVEVSGRSCYMSFPDGKGGYVNPNVSRHRRASKDYLQNIISDGDGSIFEHGWATFAFTNVSRVFTHELVRHRVGVAISQESLRYVRFEDMGMWVPQAFRDIPGAVLTFRNHWTASEEAYEWLLHYAAEQEGVEKFDDLTFDKKKKYTSAARRVAPIGVATNIVWSANMRTLRHVIEQRTAPFAEEEIRLVFGEVGRMAVINWPNLFSDYTPEKVDGLWWYKTDSAKV